MNSVREEDQLIASFFEEQPQPAFWMSPVRNTEGIIEDFQYAYCNQEFYNYTGFGKEELIGKCVFNSPIITELPRQQKFFKQLKEVYETGIRVSDKFYNQLIHRNYSFIRSRVNDGVLTVLQDRTEEFNMLKQLEEQTAFTTSILKNSPSGITVTEVIRDNEGKVIDGRTILANEAAEQFLLIPKEIYSTKTILEIDPNMKDSPLYQMALESLETGKPFQTQYYFEPGDKWIELSVSKMDDDHLINIFSDITTNRVAHLHLEKAAERLQSIFNASQSGMFTFAAVKNDQDEVVDFRFVIANQTFASYVNQSAKKLQGELGSTWFPGYLNNGVFDMYKHTYLTGETQRQDIHYNVDGLDIYLDLLSTKVEDEVLVTFTDYTELKRAQVQLEKLVDELQRSNKYLEEFAHAASHDLKEPIRKIHTFSERLRTSFADRMSDVEADLFNRMQSATGRMTQLVDDLLTYSHVSLTPIEKEDVDLNVKVNLVLADLELQAEEKKAVINVGNLPVIKGFRRQIQQLLQNLLSNAMKYHKPGQAPVVTVSAKMIDGKDVPMDFPGIAEEDKFHLIEVADNGIGFQQQYAERIFGMFQRLHGKKEYAGTGVGLSISRKVVDNHGGHIWATGNPGEGAVFHILLPVK